jgi:alpha-1,2-mannosyltransferase
MWVRQRRGDLVSPKWFIEVREALMQRRMLVAFVFYLVVAPIYVLTASRSVTSIDVYTTALAGSQLASTGSAALDDYDFAQLGSRAVAAHRFVGRAVNGHLVPQRGPGPVAAATVAYALAGGDRNGLPLWPQALLAALLTAATATLMLLALREVTPPPVALTAAAAFALASPVWSVAADGIWPHTITLLGLAGAAYAAATERWWLVGVMGGVAVWGRVHVALIVAALGLGVAISRRQPRVALAVGVPSLGFLGLASLWTHWMFGRWEPTGGYDAATVMDSFGAASRTLTSTFVNEAGLWVSADRGILTWSPVLLLLAPALLRRWRQLPDWTRWLVVGGIIYTATQGWYSAFHGGDAYYGYRLGLEFLCCVTPALAGAWPGAGRVARTLVVPVLVLQTLAIGLGATHEGLFLPAEDAWHRNAFVTAVVGSGPGGVVVLALVAAIGALAAHIWLRPRQSSR